MNILELVIKCYGRKFFLVELCSSINTRFYVIAKKFNNVQSTAWRQFKLMSSFFFYMTILINGSVYSQCGDDTTLLGVRLPRLKSTTDDSFNVTNGHVPITKASLQAGEHGLWFDLERDGFHMM